MILGEEAKGFFVSALTFTKIAKNSPQPPPPIPDVGATRRVALMAGRPETAAPPTLLSGGAGLRARLFFLFPFR
jgi:hypothetical protein